MNVVIASCSVLVTADHDVNDPDFSGQLGPIKVEDRVWLATRVTVTKDVTIGEGAVAAAGSVVVDDVPPWTIVAGVPARRSARSSGSSRATTPRKLPGCVESQPCSGRFAERCGAGPTGSSPRFRGARLPNSSRAPMSCAGCADHGCGSRSTIAPR
jgi:hypothetical protein